MGCILVCFPAQLKKVIHNPGTEVWPWFLETKALHNINTKLSELLVGMLPGSSQQGAKGLGLRQNL